MTLPGGPADKLGNRYETWWTVSELARMLAGESEAIRIEDPGTDKTDFVVTVGSGRELHQAKVSHPSGKWSISALQSDGLLRAMGEQLAGNDDRFVFASGSAAVRLPVARAEGLSGQSGPSNACEIAWPILSAAATISRSPTWANFNVIFVLE